MKSCNYGKVKACFMYKGKFILGVENKDIRLSFIGHAPLRRMTNKVR